jgi:hypothetical protein
MRLKRLLHGGCPGRRILQRVAVGRREDQAERGPAVGGQEPAITSLSLCEEQSCVLVFLFYIWFGL